MPPLWWVGRRIAPPARRAAPARAAWSPRQGPPARLGRTPIDPPAALPEDPPIDLNALVEPRIGAIAIGLGAVVLILLLVVVLQARRISSLGRRLAGLTRGEDGRSLEAILDAHLEKVLTLGREVDDLAARSAMLEATGRRAIQRVGLVRFNPFEDTGGNQSFALALTDADGNGFVVTSLHSRAGTRVYAKTLVAGRSDAALSGEESEALRVALASAGPGAGSRSDGERDRTSVPA